MLKGEPQTGHSKTQNKLSRRWKGEREGMRKETAFRRSSKTNLKKSIIELYPTFLEGSPYYVP
jgi:hypothetical protein